MRKHFIYAALISLLLVSTNQAIAADKTEFYVTDLLRLSLYEEASDKSRILLYLTSGDKLVMEEVSGLYAKVTTSSGRKGWVKRAFLISKPTAKLLLDQEQEKNRQLKKQLDRLNNSKIVINQYEKDMNAMGAEIEALKQEKQSARTMVDNLQKELAGTRLMVSQIKAEEPRSQIEKTPLALTTIEKVMRIYWKYIAAIMLVTLLLGIWMGKAVTERAIKRKFNGVKIW